MLILDNVSKQYGSVQALVSVNLEIPEGQSTVLIGPSGCGKSTILRMITGLVTPDSGRITFENMRLDETTLADLRQRMGYVIQEGGLFPHMNVAENVTLMARYLRWSPEKIADRLEYLTELVHLTPKLHRRYPAQLSGGQRQRVSLMRALMLDPDLLLLDEPLGALDPMIRFSLQQELKEIFDKLHKTVVMVTHDIAEAAFFADTVVLMRNGSIVQRGGLREMALQPKDSFVTEFIDTQRQPMQLLMQVLS